MRTPRGKRTRELLRRLPPGVEIVPRRGRGGHLAVLVDGEELRDERGMPVRLAGTSNIAVANELAVIERALAARASAASSG